MSHARRYLWMPLILLFLALLAGIILGRNQPVEKAPLGITRTARAPAETSLDQRDSPRADIYFDPIDPSRVTISDTSALNSFRSSGQYAGIEGSAVREEMFRAAATDTLIRQPGSASLIISNRPAWVIVLQDVDATTFEHHPKGLQTADPATVRATFIHDYFVLLDGTTGNWLLSFSTARPRSSAPTTTTIAMTTSTGLDSTPTTTTGPAQ